jgi:hypothetical protein
MTECPEGKWLLLIHQIPPKPGYLRVKIWRKLQSLGAVAIKNAVYVMPRNDQTLEDFQWVLRAILEAGAEASICAASFIDGLTDEQVEALFRQARNEDYAAICREAESILDATPQAPSITGEERSELGNALARLKRRFATIKKLDFFSANGCEAASRLIEKMEFRLSESERQNHEKADCPGIMNIHEYRGRTWVTRKAVYVDRMACAWFIRRFIDPDASFRFVSERAYRPRTGELRFDMFEGEFTHDGDHCSFEVMVQRFGLTDKALLEIGRIIHDIDLKEKKYGRSETSGILALIDGIVLSRKSDEDRVERGSMALDDIYEYFRRK